MSLGLTSQMKRQTISAILFAMLAGSPAAAQDRAAGEQIAKTRCAVCHIVEGEGTAARRQGEAPSFSAIARGPNMRRSFLDTWLSSPHPGHGMPNLFLTHTEVEDVTAYILSLRPSGPPRERPAAH